MIDMVFSGRNLFILFLLLAGNFLQPLMPCNTSRVLQNSMGIRHVVGFFTLLFFVVVSDTDLDAMMPFGTLIATTLIIYAWFLIASKMTANWWLFLVMLLGALYLINLYEDQGHSALDPTTVDMLRMGKDGLLALSLFTTLIGFILYVGEKKIDYRGKFNFMDFFFSAAACKGTANIQPYGRSFQAAFYEPPGARMSGGGYLDGGEDALITPSNLTPTPGSTESKLGGYAGLPMKLDGGGSDPWAKEATPVSSTFG